MTNLMVMIIILGVKWVTKINVAPLNACWVTCVRLLTGWINGSRQLQFALPTVWRETKDRLSCSYFRLTNMTGITSKSKHTVKCLYFPSAIRPVPHREELPVLKPPEILTLSDDSWLWWRSRTARRGQCWLRNDIWCKLVLFSSPFI